MAGFTTAMAIGLVGLAGIGAMAYSSSKDKQSFTPPAVDTPDPAAAKLAAQEVTTKKRRATARNISTYTGPLGLTDIDKSNIATKTMLGE